MAVNWDYFNKFDEINDVFLPVRGEGDTKATQIVTAVNKLVYKWYNDGDVFDNTYYLSGWANNLSSYANWIYQNTDVHVQEILDGICDCNADDLQNFRNTKWQFVNAAADMADHAQPLRMTTTSRENRLKDIFNGHPLLDKSYELVLAA